MASVQTAAPLAVMHRLIFSQPCRGFFFFFVTSAESSSLEIIMMKKTRGAERENNKFVLALFILDFQDRSAPFPFLGEKKPKAADSRQSNF